MAPVSRSLGLVAIGLLTAACGLSLFGGDEREPWRAEAEAKCLASGKVHESAALRLRSELDGPGTCGADKPFVAAALAEGTLPISPNATITCPMVVALDEWVAEVLQPAAQQIFLQPVVALRTMGSYGCRSRNNIPGARLSEHAFANAIDISTFELADGRRIAVKTGWKGAPDEQAFLRAVHAGACKFFTTVLGPGADAFHYDHIHVDLARHDRLGRHHACKPRPQEPAIAGPLTPFPAPAGPIDPRVPAFAPTDEEPLFPEIIKPVPPGVGNAE